MLFLEVKQISRTVNQPKAFRRVKYNKLGHCNHYALRKTKQGIISCQLLLFNFIHLITYCFQKLNNRAFIAHIYYSICVCVCMCVFDCLYLLQIWSLANAIHAAWALTHPRYQYTQTHDQRDDKLILLEKRSANILIN